MIRIGEYFKQTYEDDILKARPFIDLKGKIIYNQGYISQTEYDQLMRELKFCITRFCINITSVEIHWDYILENSKALNDVLSQLNIITDEEYRQYEEKKSLKEPLQPIKLTAPDLSNGIIICIILCCVFFVFNYFWIYWIIIWICYYFWRKEQIIKFNPQHFRKED